MRKLIILLISIAALVWVYSLSIERLSKGWMEELVLLKEVQKKTIKKLNETSIKYDSILNQIKSADHENRVIDNRAEQSTTSTKDCLADSLKEALIQLQDSFELTKVGSERIIEELTASAGDSKLELQEMIGVLRSKIDSNYILKAELNELGNRNELLLNRIDSLERDYSIWERDSSALLLEKFALGNLRINSLRDISEEGGNNLFRIRADVWISKHLTNFYYIRGFTHFSVRFLSLFDPNGREISNFGWREKQNIFSTGFESAQLSQNENTTFEINETINVDRSAARFLDKVLRNGDKEWLQSEYEIIFYSTLRKQQTTIRIKSTAILSD